MCEDGEATDGEATLSNTRATRSEQGRYRRTGFLWSNEELNKKATKYVRGNANVKGKPNMTSIEFCQWVNNNLLKNSTLEPGFPRSVSLSTAVRWLHHLGFEVLTPKKGVPKKGVCVCRWT